MAHELEPPYPFSVHIDERFDPDSVFVQVRFSTHMSPIARNKFRDTLLEWGEHAVTEGFNATKIDYMDDLFEWENRGRQVQIYLDMGSINQEEAQPILDSLFAKLTEFGTVAHVNVGTGYEEWE